ncbi:putative nuclease HARBI1 [Ictalurus furcatus]|uniref:putative nuclease HARBI1 n=1 Tax=Ictalurus furcatus TaxID=66913 RepID=UPI00235080CE|nr:putative nuclease HARBI1 [Ictalurus furcatus]
MELETCIAFLLADELDAEEYAHLKKPLTTRGIRGGDDDDDDDDDDEDDEDDDEDKKSYFSATVPSLSVLDFQKCFQLTQPQVEELVNLLSPCEWTTLKLEGWTVMHAVLASLWALSTLEAHSSVAARFHTSESLIRLHLNDFCTLITNNFADRICWPKWKEAETSVAGFLTNVGLPGTVCVLGSCSIPIDRPSDVPDPEVYRDSVENAYSVTLLAFCNHQGCFTFVNAEHPGNWHNSRVLQETEVGKALQEDPLNLLHGKHVIGDGTFPLSEHLLTPFPDYGMLGEKKLRYNLRVQAALRVVRGSLSSLRCRFQRLRCLEVNSVSQTHLAVRTCCILYNMYLETDNAATAESLEEQVTVQPPFHKLPHGHSGSLGGISKRQDIAASLGRKSKKR